MGRTAWLAALVIVGAWMSAWGTAGESGTGVRGPYFGQKPPGMTPQLFAPDIFDARHGYHSPVVFSPDLSEAVWSPMEREQVLLHSRRVDGEWTAPEVVNFGMESGVGDAVFSPDGRTLAFLSFQPPHPGDPVRERIWLVTRTGDGWSRPRPVDAVVRAHPTHWTFSFAGNGNLYFTSESQGVRGEQDVFVAPFDGGKYREPRSLGEAVNSDGRDLAPFVAPDESYLVFTRNSTTTRKADLYISFRDARGAWTPAVELGPGINSDHNDLCGVVSPDGKYLFFLSMRDGKSRMYWVDAGVITRMNKDGS